MTSWTELADPAARAAIAAYFSKVDRALAPLTPEDAAQIRGELEAHASDAIAQGETAEAALASLGEPNDYLPMLVADHLRRRAGKTFRPRDIAAAIIRGGSTGIAGMTLSIVVGCVYALATLSVALGVIKMFAPRGVGIYRLHDGRIFIGADETIKGADLLGMWFSPIAILIGFALYCAMTFVFAHVRLRRRRRAELPIKQDQ